jgi:hypothetical protein
MTMFKKLMLMAVCLLPMSLAQAHHAGTIYDKEHPVEITGVVKQFRWMNPHAFLALEVPAKEGGTELWNTEGPSVMMLSRNGWRSSSIKVGDQIRVLVAPQKNGTHAGSFMRVFLKDGTVLETGRIE